MNDNIYNSSWERYCKRFVAFLDIAGFKAMCNQHIEDDGYIHDILNHNAILSKLEQSNHENLREYLYILNISDSIIVISKDDSEMALSCLTLAVGEIFNYTFVQAPINGAIAPGLMSVDIEKNIFFGQAYNLAYMLQEQMDYYGIVCDSSVEEYLQRISPDSLLHNVFVKIQSYFKGEKESKPKACVNYIWFDSLKFGTISYTAAQNFVRDKDLSELPLADENGVVCGTYEERIGATINRHYSKCDEKSRGKIGRRLNNTMQSIKDLLCRYRDNHHKCRV